MHVGLDNLNTHRPASLYDTFAPAEARGLLKRLRLHYMPKHASWLNMAEIELSVLSRPCLDRRIADEATLRQEVEALVDTRNQAGARIEWRFTSQNARVKLHRPYPSVSG